MRNSDSGSVVLAYGELLWDILPSGPVLGGAPANFAYRLHQLGTAVNLISCVGDDELGEEARSKLAAMDLNTSFIQSARTAPTGTVTVQLSTGGDAHYQIHENVAYDFIEFDEASKELAQRAAAICFGTLVQRAPKTRETLYRLLDEAHYAFKLVDINLRRNCYSAETLHSSLSQVDLLKLNHEEAKIVGELLGLSTNSIDGFTKSAMQKYPLNIILVTHGRQGVMCFNRDGAGFQVNGYNVEVVDTVGSGDNFTAGFLHKFLLGEDLESCCKFANRVGALCASKKGGMPEISLFEIQAMADAHVEAKTSAQSGPA